ncbi:MAG: SRPBCC family protein [Polyangiaceae bacterium]
MMHVLEREQLVARPRSEVFAFFSDAANLERLTPNSLKFRIKTATPIAMRAGALIDYEIKLSGLPMQWRTLIEVYEPESRFVDLQVRGPYKLWRHTHAFADAPGGGTEMSDRVEYELPLGPLGSIAHALFVKRQLASIFAFRNETMKTLFPAR